MIQLSKSMGSVLLLMSLFAIQSSMANGLPCSTQMLGTSALEILDNPINLAKIHRTMKLYTNATTKVQALAVDASTERYMKHFAKKMSRKCHTTFDAKEIAIKINQHDIDRDYCTWNSGVSQMYYRDIVKALKTELCPNSENE